MLKQIIFLTAILISGCTTMSPQQCATQNWQQVGYQDATQGKASQVLKYRKMCQNAVEQPYLLGFKQGLATYCQPQQIFKHALQGQGTYTHCDNALSLKESFDVAHRYYAAKQDYYNAQTQYANYIQLVENSKTPEQDKMRYQKQLSDIEGDAERVKRKYENAKSALARFKAEHGYA